jgi:hypothetical protein
MKLCKQIWAQLMVVWETSYEGVLLGSPAEDTAASIRRIDCCSCWGHELMTGIE